MTEAKVYSFELNPDMVNLLHQEFQIEKVVDRFAEATKGKKTKGIETIGQEYFEAFGRDWMTRAIQLGEEYPDRTDEVLRAAIDHTGVYKFPFLLQRFIEIAYLRVMGIYTLPIVQNSYDRLTYKMVECPMFKALAGKCGRGVANQLPCQHACLTACRTVAQNFGVDVAVEMQGATSKDEYCQFSLTPI